MFKQITSIVLATAYALALCPQADASARLVSRTRVSLADQALEMPPLSFRRSRHQPTFASEFIVSGSYRVPKTDDITLAKIYSDLAVAAERMGLSQEQYDRAISPVHILHVTFPVEMDNGEIIEFEGWRIIFEEPAQGGIRFAEDANQDEVMGLAIAMGIKTAMAGLGVRGAKGAIATPMDPNELSLKERERMMRGYVRSILNAYEKTKSPYRKFGERMGLLTPHFGWGPLTNGGAPDMRSGKVDMRIGSDEALLWISEQQSLHFGGAKLSRDNYNRVWTMAWRNLSDTPLFESAAHLASLEPKLYRGLLTFFTGIPAEEGGIAGRDAATGEGVVLAALNALIALKDSFVLQVKMGFFARDHVVIIHGAGNVGFFAAMAAARRGSTVRALSDVDSEFRPVAIIKESGFTMEELLKIQEARSKAHGDWGVIRSMAQEIGARSTDDPKEFWMSGTPDRPLLVFPCARQETLGEREARWILESRAPGQRTVIVEGANGPTTASAEAILRQDPLVTIVPDILANGGGVTVSYFSQVQNRRGEVWTEEETNAKLEHSMGKAFQRLWEASQIYKLDLRLSAYVLWLEDRMKSSVFRKILPRSVRSAA